MKKLSKRLVSLTFGLGMTANLWQSVLPVRAADHKNLEEGLPTDLEDAYPIEYQSREVQGQFRYERQRNRRGKNLFTLDPRLEYGFVRNGQLTISAPFLIGSADRTGGGDLTLTGLYNFNTESLSTPAFAISARTEFPTGYDTAGVGTELKFIATKSLGAGTHLDRLHLNVSWLHNTGPQSGQRSDRYRAILGYSRRLGPDTIIVTDFERLQELDKGRNDNIVEAGIRRQLTPRNVLSVGAGVGIGSDSPDYRITVGFQRTL